MLSPPPQHLKIYASHWKKPHMRSRVTTICVKHMKANTLQTTLECGKSSAGKAQILGRRLLAVHSSLVQWFNYRNGYSQFLNCSLLIHRQIHPLCLSSWTPVLVRSLQVFKVRVILQVHFSCFHFLPTHHLVRIEPRSHRSDSFARYRFCRKTNVFTPAKIEVYERNIPILQNIEALSINPITSRKTSLKRDPTQLHNSRKWNCERWT